MYMYIHSKAISVAVDGNKRLVLPDNHVRIFGSTWPSPTNPDKFHYEWDKLAGPMEGSLEGVHMKTVELKNVRNYLSTLTKCHGLFS